MRTLLTFILLFISAYSYSQALPPDISLFNDSNSKNINVKEANAVLQVSIEIKQPIAATVTDDMKYLTGIVVDVETREIEETNVVSKEAKITVRAEPNANYTVRLNDGDANSNNSLAMSLPDKQDKRTLPASGLETFQVSGFFVNDTNANDNQDELAPKSITVVYDSV